MRLSVHDSVNGDTVIADVSSREEADSAISKWLDDNDITWYYMRHWMKDGLLWTDYGSHTRFLVLDTNE